MDNEKYRKVLRLLGAIVAVTLWFISMNFSQDGFAINVPSMAWVGWLMAFSITVIEMIWNQEGFGHNLTITVVALASYAYGIWTNFIGVVEAQGGFPENIWDNPLPVIFPMILGLFLEIVPEPLLTWSLIGVNKEDILSHFSGAGKRTIRKLPNVAPAARNGPIPNFSRFDENGPTMRPIQQPIRTKPDR